MNRLPIVEKFGPAIQGEGLLAGTPSLFIRVFGCNLRCQFGCSSDEYAAFRKQLAEDTAGITNLDDFPVVSTGCDTPYSIFPEYRRFTKTESPLDLERWVVERLTRDMHLVITGGEPLLPGYQEAWEELLENLKIQGYDLGKVTFETNGTQPLTGWFSRFLWRNDDVNFSISPKLSCSGMAPEKALVPDAIQSYEDAGVNMWFKFVVASDKDAEEALEAVKSFGLCCDYPIYFMPMGGTKDTLSERATYELALKYGVRYSPRLQVSILDNGIGV